ncbi:MBL fold metallo-hydrolase [Leucobacter iarius]|uniref:MBL fold metallo-hydrolase n=1 Tax=Leucobacter iarius TaxID=333963 RepID=A0ABN2LHA7_9MICO
MNSPLPIVDRWFVSESMEDGITRIEEPYADEFLRGNIWHVAGDDRDLVVDSGLGIGSLRTEFPELFANNPVLVVTHAHLDHMGSAYEFADLRAHALEPLHAPHGTSIRGDVLAAQLGLSETLPELLVTARTRSCDPERYEVRPVVATVTVAEGDVIDLGNRRLQILHLPGHTPGSICLFDWDSGALFSGDVVYDDDLLDDLFESDDQAYVRSMHRLRDLPVRTVYPGHGESFNGHRLREIIDSYLRAATRTV